MLLVALLPAATSATSSTPTRAFETVEPALLSLRVHIPGNYNSTLGFERTLADYKHAPTRLARQRNDALGE